MAGLIAGMGETRNAYGVLVGKPEGKRTLGRPRHRWVDNIKMDLREIGWDGTFCKNLLIFLVCTILFFSIPIRILTSFISHVVQIMFIHLAQDLLIWRSFSILGSVLSTYNQDLSVYSIYCLLVIF
jgi:hypothetical protein